MPRRPGSIHALAVALLVLVPAALRAERREPPPERLPREHFVEMQAVLHLRLVL